MSCGRLFGPVDESWSYFCEDFDRLIITTGVEAVDTIELTVRTRNEEGMHPPHVAPSIRVFVEKKKIYAAAHIYA